MEPTGPAVPVRALPLASGAVQSLRPRQPLLRPSVPAPGPRSRPARDCQAAISAPSAAVWPTPHDPGAGANGHAEAAQNVTHQGSQAGAADAPLAAWTHDIATVSTVSTVTTVSADAQGSTALPSDPDPQTQPCRRCRRPLGLLVRLGFLRHGLRTVMPAGRRHDHSP